MSTHTRCVYCLSEIVDEVPMHCAHCGTTFHEECWDLNEGCATLGCAGCVVGGGAAAAVTEMVPLAPLPSLPAMTPPPRTSGAPSSVSAASVGDARPDTTTELPATTDANAGRLAPSPVEPPPVAPVSISRQFCDQCGSRVAPTDRFCGTCGSPMEEM